MAKCFKFNLQYTQNNEKYIKKLSIYFQNNYFLHHYYCCKLSNFQKVSKFISKYALTQFDGNHLLAIIDYLVLTIWLQGFRYASNVGFMPIMFTIYRIILIVQELKHVYINDFLSLILNVSVRQVDLCYNVTPFSSNRFTSTAAHTLIDIFLGFRAMRTLRRCLTRVMFA